MVEAVFAANRLMALAALADRIGSHPLRAAIGNGVAGDSGERRQRGSKIPSLTPRRPVSASPRCP